MPVFLSSLAVDSVVIAADQEAECCRRASRPTRKIVATSELLETRKQLFAYSSREKS